MSISQEKNIVLLVEDDGAIVNAIERFFKNDGIDIHIHVAQDGEEGLSLAKKLKPDLILLDLLMPKIDGLSMLAELRKDPWGKNVPVVILTNLSSSEKEKATKELGAVEYVIKSNCTMEEIVEKIKVNLGL
ncbi:response regulator [Patescibacteria group bacterium]|nr:response regulator [Patescibacteria group bacterium]